MTNAGIMMILLSAVFTGGSPVVPVLMAFAGFALMMTDRKERD